MVLSLVDTCRVSLRNLMESGRDASWQRLPPIFRQSILDLIILHGTINSPNCVDVLGSTDFLEGFTLLDLSCNGETRSQIADNRLLDRAARSMATISENGETIGSSIEKLRLDLRLFEQHKVEEYLSIVATNFENAVRLISQCPNLRSLRLRVVEPFYSYFRDTKTINLPVLVFDKRSTSGGLLNDNDYLQLCRPIFEKLTELSLSRHRSLRQYYLPIIANNFPVIRFKNLASLSIKGFKLGEEAWRQLLYSVQDTLTDLRLRDLSFVPENKSDGYYTCRAEVALPFPLRRLERLEFGVYSEYSMEFVQILADCDALQNACLTMWLSMIGDEELTALASIKIQFNIGLHVSSLFSSGNKPPFDTGLFTKLIDLFGENITKLSLDKSGRWNPESAAAFVYASEKCPNLTTLELPSTNVGFLSMALGTNRDMGQAAETRLCSFFDHRERAGQLRKLVLGGNYSEAVLASLFGNCVNLETLDISQCSNLADAHLITWAKGGATPRKLVLFDGDYLGDDGLIPVLVNSGSRLTRINFSRTRNVTDRTWNVFIDYCPNCITYGMPDALLKKWVYKRFRGPNDFEQDTLDSISLRMYEYQRYVLDYLTHVVLPVLVLALV